MISGNWCDFCGNRHSSQDDFAYDLDGWRPNTLLEVRDAMQHAYAARVLSSTSHYALDKLLTHTLRLLAGGGASAGENISLLWQILFLYENTPKWYG